MTSSFPPNNRTPEYMPLHAIEEATTDDELLVAYLDGELEAAQVTKLEARLSTEISLRRQLDKLRSAWDLLDDLPIAKPDPNFAQSTIEMVAMSAAQLESPRVSGRIKQAWWVLSWLTIPLLGMLGYMGVRGWYRLEERGSLEQVHLLADWDALEAVGSYQWLEKLKLVKDMPRVTRRTSTSELGVGLVPKSIGERRAWIAALSRTDRDRLSANSDKFKQFKRNRPTGELASIIELADRIYSSDHALDDLQVVRNYAIFLSDMNVSDRASHLDTQDLGKRLQELTDRVNRKLIEVYANELTAESIDKQAIDQWKSDMDSEYRASLRDDETVESDLEGRLAFRNSIIPESELDQLMNSMTPEAQEIFGRLQDKSMQHMALIMYFISPRPPRRMVDRSQAIDQFQKQPAERQAQLEFLPPEQVQSQIGLGSASQNSTR